MQSIDTNICSICHYSTDLTVTEHVLGETDSIPAFQFRRSSAAASPLSSKVESAVIIRLLAEVDAAAALCSDKPVRGRRPPSCLRYTNHSSPTSTDGERKDRVTNATNCLCHCHLSFKNADKTADQADFTLL
ncbi:hypothetical protein PAMP_018414 [Pampus punctatissimus]